MKRLLAFLLCAIMLLGLLSGCGTSAEPTGGAGSPVPAAEPTGGVSSPTPAAEPTGGASSPAPAAEPTGGVSSPTPAAERPEETEAPENRITTLMVYMIGSDLESGSKEATFDLQEIVDSGLDPEMTRVLVCAGGTRHWHNEWMDMETETLLHLTADGFEKLGSLPLQSMGEPACLAAFINYCTENYPSDHYALILWDHGNGPVKGYGADLQFEADGLTLSEMRQAMEQTPFAGELRLDWVGFDACLMASAELACVWADYADYLIASQEVEPHFGWDYSFLRSCGTLSPKDLGRLIADSYLDYAQRDFAKNEFFHADVTMSVLDLSRAGELEDAVNALFRAAARDVSGDYVRLARARVDSRGLGRASTRSEYDLVDLQTVAESLAGAYPEESAALLAALEDMVVYSGSNTSHCCGMSLYYPFYNKKEYRSSWKDIYRDLAVFPDYLSYLERYETIWLGSDMKRFFSDSLELQAGAQPSTYTLQLTPEQAEVYAGGWYYILRRQAGDLYCLIFSGNEVSLDGDVLTADFDGNIFYFGSDYLDRSIPLSRLWDTVDKVSSYSAFPFQLERGEYSSPDYESVLAEIRFSVDRSSNQMEVMGIYPMGDDETYSGSKQKAIDLKDWERLSFYELPPRYLTRDEDGMISSYWDWTESGIYLGRAIAIANHPHFSFEPLYDDGMEYFILINFRDVQGNEYRSELFPLQLPPAPEREEQAADTVIWDGGDSVLLLDKEGVRLSLSSVLDLESGAPLYCVTGVNLSDQTVSVSLGDSGMLINDEYLSGVRSSSSLYLEPGETKTLVLPELARGVALSSRDRLCSLESNYQIRRSRDSAILDAGRIRLTIPVEAEPQLRWDSVLEARAEEQPLLDEDGLRVTLLGLGKPPCSDPAAALRVENASGSEKELVIEGMIFNGCFLPCRQSLSLGDGELWLPTLRLDENRIRFPDYSGIYGLEEDWEQLPRISSISEAALLLQIDGTPHVCPIALTERGDQAPLEAEGSPLYQDELMELLLFRHEQLPSQDGPTEIWYFWLVNRSDHPVSCTVSYLDLNSASFLDSGWGLIPPGGRRFCSYAEPSGDETDHSFSINVFADPFYETPQIQLPTD